MTDDEFERRVDELLNEGRKFVERFERMGQLRRREGRPLSRAKIAALKRASAVLGMVIEAAESGPTPPEPPSSDSPGSRGKTSPKMRDDGLPWVANNP